MIGKSSTWGLTNRSKALGMIDWSNNCLEVVDRSHNLLGDDQANSPSSASHEGVALDPCQPCTTEPVEPVESPHLTPLPGLQILDGQSPRTCGTVEALDQGTTEVTAYGRSEEIAAHHKMQEPCLLATDDQTESKRFNWPRKAAQDVIRDSASDENVTDRFPGRASNRLPTEPCRSGPSRCTPDSSLLVPFEERAPNVAGDGVEEDQMKSEEQVPRRDNEGDARSIRDTQDEDTRDDPPRPIIDPSNTPANQTHCPPRLIEPTDWLPRELEEHQAPISQETLAHSEVNETVQQIRLMPSSPCSDTCSPRSSTTTFFTAPEE
ncbi:hypothetical protein ACEPAF_8824 [Sanghuangporus sanghuang]